MKSLIAHKEWWLVGLLALGALVFATLALATGNSTEILVEWSTASELDTIGYNLYRADSAAAPYSKINSALIPASPDPQTGGNYSFSDKDVIAGTVYFYELEAVSSDGQTERHGPIVAEAQSSSPATWILAIALGIAALILAWVQFRLQRSRN